MCAKEDISTINSIAKYFLKIMPFIATEEMCFSTYFTIKSEICPNKTVTHPLYSIRFNTHLLYTFCGMAYDKIESPCLPHAKKWS